MPNTTRRQILRIGTLGLAGATLGLGCGTKNQSSPTSPANPPDSGPDAEADSLVADSSASDVVDAADVATPSCDDTEDNILGPYWREGAPTRSDLVDPPTMKGVRFALAGMVRAEGCKVPLAGATLDFWQADDSGAYDDGIWPPPPTVYRLRGRVIADKDGRYAIKTIIPGHYLNGSQYRPAHIHVIVQAVGYKKLTTQLYFEGDPYNDIDPYIKKSLIMKLAAANTGKSSTFDFVLPPV